MLYTWSLLALEWDNEPSFGDNGFGRRSEEAWEQQKMLTGEALATWKIAVIVIFSLLGVIVLAVVIPLVICCCCAGCYLHDRRGRRCQGAVVCDCFSVFRSVSAFR